MAEVGRDGPPERAGGLRSPATARVSTIVPPRPLEARPDRFHDALPYKNTYAMGVDKLRMMRSMSAMGRISDLLETLGGAAEVAKARGKPYSTVASWKARNAIPVDEWPGLVNAARLRGVEELTYEKLVEVHTSQRGAS